MDIRAALRGQYHAALTTLKVAIGKCPQSLWVESTHPSAYWQVAYHALFFTHLYLVQNEEAFTPWEHHIDQYNFLEELPWPPHDPPTLHEPYTKEQVLAYWELVDAMVDPTVDALDLEADNCGFWWYEMNKLEHEWMNVRHTQHHAAQLADRLERATGQSIDWMPTRSAGA